MPNSTTTAPTGTFVATRLKTLFSLEGSIQSPVRNITFRGLKITTTAASYLDPHYLPSDGGGDWALARSGAVFLQGTEGVVLNNNTYERLDGNGVFISGYNRDAEVSDSEFIWIGENAIVSSGFSNDPSGILPTGCGPDGTTGNHPEGNRILGNLIHEIGHFQKYVIDESCDMTSDAKTSLL